MPLTPTWTFGETQSMQPAIGPAPSRAEVRRAGRDAVSPFRARDPGSGFRAAENRKGLPHMASIDSLQARRTLSVGGTSYVYYSLSAAEDAGLKRSEEHTSELQSQSNL